MGDAVLTFLRELVSQDNPLWLFYPLCAVVAIVYKATKFDGAWTIFREALYLFLQVGLGMLALAIFLYIVSEIC